MGTKTAVGGQRRTRKEYRRKEIKARDELNEKKCWVKEQFWSNEKERRSTEERVARRNESNLTDIRDIGGNELTVRS
jgi:hypothetical protein